MSNFENSRAYNDAHRREPTARELRQIEKQQKHAERLAQSHCQFHDHFIHYCYDCRRRARLNNLPVPEGDPGTDLPGHERPKPWHELAMRGDYDDLNPV